MHIKIFYFESIVLVRKTFRKRNQTCRFLKSVKNTKILVLTMHRNFTNVKGEENILVPIWMNNDCVGHYVYKTIIKHFRFWEQIFFFFLQTIYVFPTNLYLLKYMAWLTDRFIKKRMTKAIVVRYVTFSGYLHSLI